MQDCSWQLEFSRNYKDQAITCSMANSTILTKLFKPSITSKLFENILMIFSCLDGLSIIIIELTLIPLPRHTYCDQPFKPDCHNFVPRRLSVYSKIIGTLNKNTIKDFEHIYFFYYYYINTTDQ